MCGLASVVGDLRAQDVAAFKDLLTMASMRGVHSSGVATIGLGVQHEFNITKCLGGPANLMETKGWDRTVNASKAAIIGHCRHATLGEVTHENAHPFDAGHIVGAHNGTLSGGWKQELGHLWSSDSKAIFKTLEHKDPEDFIPKLDGAWALTWFDRVADTFNILRNAERPLYYAKVDNGRVIFVGSEYLQVMYALLRDGRYKTDEFKVEAVPPDTLMSFPVAASGRPGEPTLTKIEKERRFQGGQPWEDGDDSWFSGRRWDWAKGHHVKAPDKGEQKTAEKTQTSVVPVGGTHAAPSRLNTASLPLPSSAIKDGKRTALDGSSVDKQTFNLCHRCVSCGTIVAFDHPKVTLINEYEYICPPCTDETPQIAKARLEHFTKES